MKAVTLSVEDLERLVGRTESHPAHFDEDTQETVNRAREAIQAARRASHTVNVISPPEATEMPPLAEEMLAYLGSPSCRGTTMEIFRAVALSATYPIRFSAHVDGDSLEEFIKMITQNDDWLTGFIANFEQE